jgi:hypothetical protein
VPAHAPRTTAGREHAGAEPAAAGIQELQLTNHCTYPIEAVCGCAQLRKLSLNRCTVSDLSPLAGCVHLEDLYCDARRTPGYGEGSCISDLAPLGGCVKLKKLWIANTQVSDLAPLRGCVEPLEGLQACSDLKHLIMFRCGSVSSLAPLSACAPEQGRHEPHACDKR